MPGYLYEGDLGASATGRVVRARHEATGTPVAITYLSAELAADPAFREAFRAEAELLGGLDSPYVARFHAYVEDGQQAAIVRELVDGVGLDTLLREKGATGPEPALAVLKGSLLGLGAAHEAGVAHRDYQPANVLITTEGAVKIADFGLAARSAESGTPEGTPSYVVADLYAAAGTFYECLTGSTPYAGATEAELAVQHAEAPVPDGQVPAPVRPLVARGLAKEPAQRPQGAADFVAELEALAVAAYGADWEERGRLELAALVGQLTAPPPPPAPESGGLDALLAGKPPTGGAEDRKPRFGRRAKILAVIAATVIVAGALTVTAVATGNGDDKSTAATTPTPTVATSAASAPAPPAPTPTTATPSPSPTATTPSPTATPTPTPSHTPTVSPTTTPTAVPTTPSASPSPTKTTGSAAGPHVSSVAVTGFTCSTGSRTATATVLVRYDGTAAGTLHLTWWRSATGKPQGAVTQTPQTAHFPKGAVSYTFTDSFTFKADAAHPYVGLTVSTDPAAASGNGSYGVGCR